MLRKLLTITAIFIIVGFLVAIVLEKFHKSPLSQKVSFSTSIPEGDAQLQRTVYKTNSWFSSLYTFPSSPVYMQPGVFRFTDEGIEFGVPGVTTVEGRVQASFSNWCVLQWENGVKNTHVASYGDFDVRLELESPHGKSRVNLIQGSPFIVIEQAPSTLTLQCKNGIVATPTDQGILLSNSSTKIQVLVQAENTVVDKTSAVLSSALGKYRLLFIPEKLDVRILSEMPWEIPYGTLVQRKQDFRTNEWITTYSQLSEDPSSQWSIIYPHHLSYLSDEFQIYGTYDTVLGQLQLVHTDTFQTHHPNPQLPSNFIAVQNESQIQEIKSAIKQDATQYLNENPPAGVYFRGTWLGALVTLTQLAELYQLNELAVQLEEKLLQVFTESSDQFVYDAELHLLKAKNSEFGNEFGNDHHFHYGYYIRVAAYLQQKGQLNEKLQHTVNELVQDIATTDRTSDKYPVLRNYSLYEGHSWADGRAQFADGNNQESTSEALNAWYSLVLWGRAISNKDLEETGAWLFSQELSGTTSYWFGINNPFPQGYDKPLASLIWAGKREFTTWFSPHPSHIIGIQYLPITPASQYLGEVEKHNDLFSKLQDLDTNFDHHEWFDLHLAVLSYTNPKLALSLIRPDIGHGGLKLKSLLLQTIFQNQTL